PPQARGLARGCPHCPHLPHRLHWRSASVGDAVDESSLVVADIEGAIGPDGEADWAPKGIIAILEPASGEVLGRASDVALGVQGNENNLVSGGDAAVPGAVKGDVEAAVALGELGGTLVEGEAEGRGVGLHLDARLNDTVAGAGMAKVRVYDGAGLAIGPAVVA